MMKRILPYILIAVTLSSCMNADLAPFGDDLLSPQLTISDPSASEGSLDVTFKATLSQAITNENCGFYLSADADFANSEKVSADNVTNDKGSFSYTRRIMDFGSRWYCKAYASNGRTVILSSVCSYQVGPFSSYVSAGAPEVISSVDGRAELRFTVSAAVGVSLSESGVCYGEAPVLSIESAHVVSGGSTGTHNVSIDGLTVGKEYYVCSYARKEENIVYSKAVSLSARSSVPEIVDLGVSVKWASFNIGATSPEEPGGYYQWAGLEDVTSRSIYLYWNNCPYHTGSNDETGWIKYVPSDKSSYWSGSGSPDNKTVLDLSDDIAHVKLGGKWRMPTYAEWIELRENCTWTWTTQNGVKGYKVTSKKSGYTSKSIFLPAAGYRLYDNLDYDGSGGYYWSSSLNTFSPLTAFILFFNSGSVYTSNNYRYNGLSVRPVYGDRVSVTGVSLSKTNLSLNIGVTSTLSATVTPSNAAEQSVSWSSNNTSVATVDQSGNVTAVKPGTATITVKTTDGGYTATCSVTVTLPVPEAVDLGLNVKWASFNLGASCPEEYGGYYQWAGLEDVTSTGIYLDWNNCPYHMGSDKNTGWTKYVPSDKSSYWSGSGSPDNKTVIDPSDDIAHVKLGGKWRMPTDAEWTELRENCTWTWTTQNGVNGYKVTSKKSGYTSKSIFLPAAGCRVFDILYYVGSYGYYWSSSLGTGSPCDAYYVYFDSDYVYRGSGDRFSGLSVRPVSE